MTKSDEIQFKIDHTKYFLEGQLDLYKIEFVDTSNNKYLEVMHEMNESLKVIKYLESSCKKLMKENRELKK